MERIRPKTFKEFIIANKDNLDKAIKLSAEVCNYTPTEKDKLAVCLEFYLEETVGRAKWFN